jgi:hypothetical protein
MGKCEGIKRNGNGLELCGTEIEGRDVYKHNNHTLCADCILNLRFNCRTKRWTFFLERLMYINTFVDEYDYEEKIKILKMKEMRR